MTKIQLDREERELLDSFEREEWIPAKNQTRESDRHRRYAKNTLIKDKRVNIRISSKDLEGLRTIAVEDGIPYQTLMASVLHKYVSGRLVEVPSRTSESR